jgi:transcription initiation factor TFIIF subunit beta
MSQKPIKNEIVPTAQPEEFTLDTENSNKQVWLVKVPKSVADDWEKNKETQVGEVIIDKNKVKVNLNNSMSYEMVMTKPTPLYMFSRDSKQFAVRGSIEQLCSMRIVQDATNKLRYEEKMKQRIEKSNEKKESQTLGLDTIKRGFSQPTKKKGAELEAKTSNFRVRGEVEEVEVLVHHLFEQPGKSRWSLADLVRETDQPEAFLKKEILSKLCDYNRAGPWKGTYELKSDWKVQAERMDQDEFQEVE